MEQFCLLACLPACLSLPSKSYVTMVLCFFFLEEYKAMLVSNFTSKFGQHKYQITPNLVLFTRKILLTCITMSNYHVVSNASHFFLFSFIILTDIWVNVFNTIDFLGIRLSRSSMRKYFVTYTNL